MLKLTTEVWPLEDSIVYLYDHFVRLGAGGWG